jgi:hypothetical protein
MSRKDLVQGVWCCWHTIYDMSTINLQEPHQVLTFLKEATESERVYSYSIGHKMTSWVIDDHPVSRGFKKVETPLFAWSAHPNEREYRSSY